MSEPPAALAFVLIHSPVVGPCTWAGVAETLRGQRHEVVVPSLLDALHGPPPFWRQMARAVGATVQSARPATPLVLVGHSGAGPLLPVLRAALSVPVAGYVFVDAGLPRSATTAFERMPMGLVQHLRSLLRDGFIPPWHRWWGDEALQAHLTDAALRARFCDELSPLPLALFEERLPEIERWPDAPCAYVQLSDVYDAEATEARRLGWPYARLPSDHLGMLTDPQAVAGALGDLSAQLKRSGSE